MISDARGSCLGGRLKAPLRCKSFFHSNFVCMHYISLSLKDTFCCKTDIQRTQMFLMQSSQKGGYLTCINTEIADARGSCSDWRRKPSCYTLYFLSKFVSCWVQKNIRAEKLIVNGPKCSCTLRKLNFRYFYVN